MGPVARAALVFAAFPVVAGAVIFTAAGRFDLPTVWAVLLSLVAFAIGLYFVIDPALVRERLAPGPGNRDRVTRAVAMPLVLGHWILAGLDVGRFHWSVIPLWIAMAGAAGYAGCLGVLLWAVVANRFYSSVVRIQEDRGHQVVSTGPYRFVRHPGYAASIAGALTGGVALGSWVALLPIAAFAGLFVRRTLIEDRMLRESLAGYDEYARRVRRRLLPGVF